MQLHKYHALGNDYLILTPDVSPSPPSPELIAALCHRNYGPGADGVLYGPIGDDFSVRIYNSDGSEAENSGNGLRIFARYLYDTHQVALNQAFTIHTPDRAVPAIIEDPQTAITLDMGSYSFHSKDIPVLGHPREVVDQPVTLVGHQFTMYAVTVGNPHCVLPFPKVTPELCKKYGPSIENYPLFPNKTNVQFLQVLDPETIKIEIWERGSGYTLASGSSACAAAATAHRMGLIKNNIYVVSPGGTLQVSIKPNQTLSLTGPVTAVSTLTVSPECVPILCPA